MACSLYFRRKILEIKARHGLSFEETVLRFGVSTSSVSRRAKRLEACRTRNKPAAKIDPGQLIRDAEQHERAERFGCSQRGIALCVETAENQQGKNFFPSGS
jgi:transposase